MVVLPAGSTAMSLATGVPAATPDEAIEGRLVRRPDEEDVQRRSGIGGCGGCAFDLRKGVIRCRIDAGAQVREAQLADGRADARLRHQVDRRLAAADERERPCRWRHPG